MESNTLFPLNYRLRKTDEPVEVVAFETADKGARSENDWVSYIDAQGNEHIKEHLTLEWDFVIDSPLRKSLFDTLKPLEGRRYDAAKSILCASIHGNESFD